MRKRILALLLALVMVLGFIPASATAAVVDASGVPDLTMTQKAEWNKGAAGKIVADVTLEIQTNLLLQTPKDVVFVIDHSASQDLSGLKASAKAVADMLNIHPEMRFALVSYASTAKMELDFTTDVNDFNTAVDGIPEGSNSNAYSGLLEAKNLIESRNDTSRQACVVLLSSGYFNMNLAKTREIGGQLKAAYQVYGTRDGFVELKNAVCSKLMDLKGMAMDIGEAPKASLTVQAQLDSGFTPINPPRGTFGGDGAYTYTADITMGESLTLTFSGELADKTRTGTLPVAGKAAAEVEELNLTAEGSACDLERSGAKVVYQSGVAAGGSAVEGRLPADNLVYQIGGTAALQTSNMIRPDWNLAGWINHDKLVGSSFPITQDVETLTASWGRAFVKISSETLGNTEPQGTRMLSRDGIEAKYSDGAFYGYYLRSITLQDTVNISANAEKSWDITDTSVDLDPEHPELGKNQAGAVMAWIVPSQTGYYDLFIGCRGDIEAPEDCSSLFSFYYTSAGSKINGLEHLDTSHVTNMNSMFYSCRELTSLNLSNFKTDNVTTMAHMFDSCSELTSLDLSNFKTDNVTTMAGMFSGCSGLTSLNLNGIDTSSVTSMEQMFMNCSSLLSLDVSMFKTPNVEYMTEMFSGCSSLPLLDVSAFNTSSATRMKNMFSGCTSLTSLNVGSFNTVINDTWVTLNGMFSNCEALESLDLSNWRITRSSNSYNAEMNSMFSGCKALESITFGSQWSTEWTDGMASMFEGCSSLTTLNGISSWNTGNVRTMEKMFKGCSLLTSLDISTWRMTNVGYDGGHYDGRNNMNSMFEGCGNLTDIGLTEINVAKGCNAYDCFKDSGLEGITVKAYNSDNKGYTDLVDTGPATNAAANALQSDDSVLEAASFDSEQASPEESTPEQATPDEEAPEENTPEEDTPEEETPEENTLEEEALEEEAPEEETPEENTLEEEAPEEETPEENTLEEEAPEENTPEEEAPEENTPEEEISEEEDNLLTSRVVRSVTEAAYGSAARSVNYTETDDNSRPVYAITKAGVWDCGELEEGTPEIQYTLELQYLSEDGQSDGASGTLTVTNLIPAGLTLVPGSISVSNAMRIENGDGGSVNGVISAPSVSNGVLTFTVSGLSTGAMYRVSYRCAVPGTVTGYTQFLNTASVDDNGIVDFADPVLHYMNGTTTPTLYTVTYAYDGAPAGWNAPPASSYVSGTTITLPKPSMFGYTFNGWELGGQAYPAGASYTVAGDVAFTGSWTKDTPAVEVSYAFEEGEHPSYADAVLNTLNADQDALKYYPNTVATAPALFADSEEYTFSWKDVDEAGRFNVGSGPKKVVTGTWEKKQYSVTYVYAGAPADAAGLPAAKQYVWGTSVSLADEPSNTKTHLFQGWSMDGSELESTFEMPAKDVTVTGTWKARAAEQEQEVLIDPNGGTWNGSDLQVVMSLTDYQAQKENLPDAVMDGKVFQDWTEKTDPTGDFALIVTARWEGDAPTPVDPTPVDPTPVDPTPVDPTPVDPTPVDPTPVDPTPVDPTPVDPTPVPPTPVSPTPVSPVLPSAPSNGMTWYVITATAGEGGTITPAGRVSVSRGASQTFLIQPAAGSSIQNVIVDGRSMGAVNSYTFDNVRANHTIEASFAKDRPGSQVKWLNTRDHIAYLHGFPDETFRPGSYMTRGEAAQMFYNLLEERISAASAGYSDIPSGMWCETAVNVLHELGVMSGVGQGRFSPDRPITRAEFTAAAMKFSAQTVSNPTRFADVNEEDWFFDSVMGAAGQGWITGYSDGTFRPNAPIVRAEAAAIVNRMLGRTADTNTVDLYPDKLRQFSDVTAGYWAYYDIMEAANTHDYYFDLRNEEIWKGFAP